VERRTARTTETRSVENPPGITRTTLACNAQSMMCHFSLKKGSQIPFHRHPAVQNGYLIRGRLRMMWKSGEEFIAGPGDGWCFEADEAHGAEVLEDSEAVECFTPSRPEYEPQQ
jgi:quercetin dioxygenase-like cupin family protein